MQRNYGFPVICICLILLAGCVATQSDVDIVEKKVTYVEDDLYAASEAIADRFKKSEEETNRKLAEVDAKLDEIAKERASLSEDIFSVNSEIRKLSGKIDETGYKLEEQIKAEREINQKTDFEIRRDIDGLKKTYTDIITSISSLNTNLTAMQNDILSVNRAQVAIAETLNRLSADMIKIEERISANEQKMNANMQVFLDELTRQESDIFYLKNITAPPPAIKNYVVKSGDSLGALAEKFNTTVDALKKANKLKDDVIHPGQKLILP